MTNQKGGGGGADENMKIGFPVNRNEFGQLQTRALGLSGWVRLVFVRCSLNERNYLFDGKTQRGETISSFFDTHQRWTNNSETTCGQLLCYSASIGRRESLQHGYFVSHLLTRVQSARSSPLGFNFYFSFLCCFSRDHCRVKWKHFDGAHSDRSLTFFSQHNLPSKAATRSGCWLDWIDAGQPPTTYIFCTSGVFRWVHSRTSIKIVHHYKTRRTPTVKTFVLFFSRLFFCNIPNSADQSNMQKKQRFEFLTISPSRDEMRCRPPERHMLTHRWSV